MIFTLYDFLSNSLKIYNLVQKQKKRKMNKKYNNKINQIEKYYFKVVSKFVMKFFSFKFYSLDSLVIKYLKDIFN